MNPEILNERTYRHIDKSAWPAGVWQEEPDKTQWVDASTQLPCLAVRHPSSGHWCGYVGVTEGHPLFAIDAFKDAPQELLVHGGLTFSDFCREGAEETGVCHIPEPGQPDRVWWFGFDCAHSNDRSPASDYSSYGRYRELPYVQDQCRELAAQLHQIGA